MIILINILNKNDNQLQFLVSNTTKNCIGDKQIYVYGKLKRKSMSDEKTSILLSDVSIEGDLVEKDKIILDGKVSGDIKAENIITHPNSNINGNINSKIASLGGKIKGNISSDRIDIRKTADVDGVLNQQTLSIEEGATLKIKTETYK